MQAVGHRREIVMAEQSRCGMGVGTMRYPKVTLSARLNPAASAGSLLPTDSDVGHSGPALVHI